MKPTPLTRTIRNSVIAIIVFAGIVWAVFAFRSQKTDVLAKPAALPPPVAADAPTPEMLDTEWLVDNRTQFFEDATQPARDEAVSILAQVRLAIWPFASLHYTETFCRPGSAVVDHRLECFFKSNRHYREEASGKLNYTYITDGTAETSDYPPRTTLTAAPVAATPVARDANARMFLEQFPARIGLDQDLVSFGEATFTSPHGTTIKAKRIGNSFCDLFVNEADQSIAGVIFFSRGDRHFEMVRIADVTYQSTATMDDAVLTSMKCRLPTGYFMHTRREGDFDVKISYESGCTADIPAERFKLALQ